MTTNNLQDVIATCRQAESFLVTSHTGPDGDSIGSILAMRYFLEALGKSNITCASQDPVPRIYDWLPGVVEIVDAEAVSGPYDLVVVLDVAQRARIGRVGEKLPENQTFLILDHHPEDEPFGIVNFVDRRYAACTEIVQDLFEAAGLKLSKPAATAIYVGLVTDTGGFRFGNTDARAHAHASKLLELDIDPSDVSSRVFDVMSLQKAELLKRVLERLHRSDCERHAWSYLTETDLKEVDADSEDTEGLVNFLRNLEGIKVASLFRELQPGKVKVSLRARKPIDAGLILKPFGGGGHSGAGGAILHAPLSETMDKISEAVRTALGPPPSPKAGARELK